MSLTKFQLLVIETQIAEIRRVIDVANKRGDNRCGVFRKEGDKEPNLETLLKRTDNYLGTWVEIPLLKIEQVISEDYPGGGTWGKWGKSELLSV